MKVKQATIETPNYSLPVAETRLLARMMFQDGWINPADLARLACLWTPGPAEVQTVVDDVLVPAWLAANTKFQIDVEHLEAELHRKTTDDERMQMHFPRGKHYEAAQTILSQWFESQMKNTAALVN